MNDLFSWEVMFVNINVIKWKFLPKEGLHQLYQFSSWYDFLIEENQTPKEVFVNILVSQRFPHLQHQWITSKNAMNGTWKVFHDLTLVSATIFPAFQLTLSAWNRESKKLNLV